ncbi:MAG: alpha/beta fold hydrolase [Alphaproteobacteria bacterium]
MALEAGFEPVSIATTRFDLFSWVRTQEKTGPLIVYVEGDGPAWPSRYRPPRDPTPRRSLVLRLASADPARQVAYLARPCQFTGGRDARNCSLAHWTERRYAPEIIDAMDAALDTLLDMTGSSTVELVGHSGGGTIAALLAARRDDVVRLVTVAGLLDIGHWVAHHELTPLTGSLDPADFASQLRHVPQLHLVGSDDDIVPASVARAFTAALGQNTRANVVSVAGWGHNCCWAEGWGTRIAQARSDK